jgi:hypothetical protein
VTESPPTRQRPEPHTQGAANTTTNTGSVPAQIRRRREASYRCEPLSDGRRDPLERRRRRQGVVEVRAIGKKTVEFTRCDKAVYGAAKTVDARIMRARDGGAWLVHQDNADDVMARLEYLGYSLEVTL